MAGAEGKIGHLSVEIQQPGVPKGGGYKDCEPDIAPAWGQGLRVEARQSTRGIRKFCSLAPRYLREDTAGDSLGGWGAGCSPPLPKSHTGAHLFQAPREEVRASTGGRACRRRPAYPPPRAPGGRPAGVRARPLLRPSRRVPPPRARSEGRSPRRPAHPPLASPIRHATPSPLATPLPPPVPPGSPADASRSGHTACTRASRVPRPHHVGHDQELAVWERRDLALADPEQRGQGRPTGLPGTGRGAAPTAPCSRLERG